MLGETVQSLRQSPGTFSGAKEKRFIARYERTETVSQKLTTRHHEFPCPRGGTAIPAWTGKAGESVFEQDPVAEECGETGVEPNTIVVSESRTKTRGDLVHKTWPPP
jgi:hypothetical protein